MSQAKTSAEIRAEIERLQDQLREMGDDPSETPLEVGQQYHLSVGLAEIIEFYEEEGVQKVQAHLWMASPEDGVTPIKPDPILFSTPIEQFRTYMSRFERDQILRSTIREREERKRNARRAARQGVRPVQAENLTRVRMAEEEVAQ